MSFKKRDSDGRKPSKSLLYLSYDRRRIRVIVKYINFRLFRENYEQKDFGFRGVRVGQRGQGTTENVAKGRWTQKEKDLTHFRLVYFIVKG